MISFMKLQVKINYGYWLIDMKEQKKDSDEDLLDLVFDADLDQYDEEWLTTTAESWIKWRTFDTIVNRYY